MDITVNHPDFKTQLLELRVLGYFSLPRILLNGILVRKNQGVYTVLNDAGQEVSISLHTSMFNTLPQVLIDTDSVLVEGKPGWTQYAGWRDSMLGKMVRIFAGSAYRLLPVIGRTRNFN